MDAGMLLYMTQRSPAFLDSVDYNVFYPANAIMHKSDPEQDEYYTVPVINLICSVASMIQLGAATTTVWLL